MKPKATKATGDQDLFRSRLDSIINMQHQLVKLAQTVNWAHLEKLCGTAILAAAGYNFRLILNWLRDFLALLLAALLILRKLQEV